MRTAKELVDAYRERVKENIAIRREMIEKYVSDRVERIYEYVNASTELQIGDTNFLIDFPNDWSAKDINYAETIFRDNGYTIKPSSGGKYVFTPNDF